MRKIVSLGFMTALAIVCGAQFLNSSVLAVLKKPTPQPAPVYRLVFIAGAPGKQDVFTMNPDGSGLTNVTKHPATYEHPLWSPDNQSIAVMSDRDGDRRLYLIKANGSGLRSVPGTGPA